MGYVRWKGLKETEPYRAAEKAHPFSGIENSALANK